MSPRSSRILLVGDIHLSDRPPSSCTETYLDDLFDLLYRTVDAAAERDVDAVVWSGDVFHHKQPGRTSHRTVQRAVEVVQAYSAPLYIVPGNHDMLHDRFDSIFETQPLGTLFMSGAKLLKGWAPDLPLYGVPWLQHWDDVLVEKALADFASSPEASNALVVTHAPLFPQGTEPPHEFYPVQDWADRQGNAGYCYYGHIHEPHGVHRANSVTFCNVGALSRGALHEYELHRKIQLALWDSEQGFVAVDIPHKEANEVFRLAEKREEAQVSARLDEFLASVSASTLEMTSIERVVEHIRQTMPDLDADVVSVIEKLFADVGA